MKETAEETLGSLLKSLDNQQVESTPYTHYFLNDCLPAKDVDDILALPFDVQDLGGVSGRREIHNNSRSYFDVENQAKYSVCSNVAEALQSKTFVDAISKAYNVDLTNCFLRIEYTQDSKGFWLEPHTDIGVKEFTMLIYLSKDPSHQNLGTDIYDSNKKHLGAAPFVSNSALVFIPADDTFHGFEERGIEGVRKSLIVNYVTDEWRAREQLAFPEHAV